MQAKTDHKRGFVWGLAFAVTMTISSIWGQAVSSGQFVRAAQVEVTPVPAAQQTNIPQMDPTAVPTSTPASAQVTKTPTMKFHPTPTAKPNAYGTIKLECYRKVLSKDYCGYGTEYVQGREECVLIRFVAHFLRICVICIYIYAIFALDGKNNCNRLRPETYGDSRYGYFTNDR